MNFDFLKTYGFSRDTCSLCKTIYWRSTLDGFCGECSNRQKELFRQKKVQKLVTYEQLTKKFIYLFKNNTNPYILVPDRTLRLSRHDVNYVLAGVCTYMPLYTNNIIYESNNVFYNGKKWTNNRFINLQTCVRFNDYENVGVTNRHGTNFIMLGQHIFEHPAAKFKEDWRQQGLKDLLLFIDYYFGDYSLYTFHESTWDNKVHQGDSIELFINGVQVFNQVYTDRLFKDQQPLTYRYIDMGAGFSRIYDLINKNDCPGLSKEQKIKKIETDYVSTIIKLANSGLYMSKRGTGYAIRKLYSILGQKKLDTSLVKEYYGKL